MGVKTAFHFRLASIGFPSATESQESSQKSYTQKGSSKEGKETSSKESKETSSKEGKEASSKKGKEAQEGKEGSTKKAQEAQEEEGTKERQKCTKTSNVCFLLVCSR